MAMAETPDISGILNTAKKMHSQGQLVEAARFYERATEAAPHHAESHYLLGLLRQKQKKLQLAADALSKAVELEPKNASMLGALGMVRTEQKKYPEALKIFDHVLELSPGSLAGMNARGIVLGHLDRNEEAVECFQYACDQKPGDPYALTNLANGLRKVGRHHEAIAKYKEAIGIAGHNYMMTYPLGRAQIFTEEYEEGITNMRRALQMDPTQLQIVSYISVAMRLMGRHEEADVLEGLDNLIVGVECPPPQGFATIEAFNEALRAELLSSPDLTEDFVGRATRNGAKVDGLFEGQRSDLMVAWEKSLRPIFTDVMAGMDIPEGHPLPRMVPGEHMYRMWANVMYRQGHQQSHNHAAGWISACYYAAVPDRVDTSGDANEGWIEFGGSAYGFPEAADAPKRRVKPEAGTMLFFPSYSIHRTIPFESDQLRISCAMDVKPLSWGRYAHLGMPD